jgi:hypothetical protein
MSRRRAIAVPKAHRVAPAAAALALLLAAGSVFAQEPGAAASAAVASGSPAPETVAQFRADPMSFFFDLRTAEAVGCGQTLLADASVTPEERRRILTVLATIYLSTGKEEPARAAVHSILAADPLAEPDDPRTLPPPVVRLFYGIRDSLLLASGGGAALDIRTLAVGDIENNSLVAGRYDLDKFARGLSQILITDLADVTPMRLVDRLRLQVLRDEIAMSASQQIVDPKYRVPFGKLTGAQSFLFGSLMQVDAKSVRLDLRWVDTATGEILLSEGVETKLRSADDLLKLERTVLIDLLLPKIREMLGGAHEADVKRMESAAKPYLQAKAENAGEGDAYIDYLLKSGEALLAEERGDLATAEAAWAEAKALAPADPHAASRSLMLAAYRRLGET